MSQKPWFRLLAVGAAVSMACTAMAADEAADDTTKQDKKEEKMVITGSRIKRTQIEGAQPVITIDQSTMKERGYVTVFEALNDLTQNNGIQIEGPEFSGGFTPDVQTVNLRGFGVGTTLMLVNGRRLAAYPAAYQSDTTVSNYGAIPAAAVDRIEILTTGASAIYGSDAVAGVINIVLKKDYEGTTINYLHGQTTESSRNTDRVQLLTGKNYADGHWMAAIEYQKRDGVFGSDYDQYDSLLDYPYGTGVLTRGVLNLNWFNLFFGLGDAYVDPGAGTCEAMGNGMTHAFRPSRGYFCGYDSAKDASFRNPSEKYSIFLSGAMQLTDDVEGFAQVLYYTSESSSKRGGLWVSEDIQDVNSDPVGFGFDWYLAQRFFTNQELGVDTSTQFEDDSLSVLVGARGTWGAHDWEFSLTHSQYEFNSARPWFKSEEVINAFLGDFNGFGFFGDPWWAGNGTFGLATNLYNPLPAAVAQQVLGTQRYGNKTQAQTAQFTLSGELGETKAGPISYAAVFEYNRQDFDFIPDARIQQPAPIQGLSGSGWWQLTGYNGTGDRTLFAVGLETEIPITKTLTFNLAGRVDSYDNTSSSIGTRFTPQAAFQWRPVEEVLVRGGYAGSFRAPDLQMVYTETGFFTGATDFVQCYQSYIFTNGSANGFDPANCDSSSVFVRRTPATQLDANSDPLEDETGYNVYLGIVVEPIERLTVSATVSETTLKDIARTESVQQLLDDEFDCFLGNLSGDRCTYVSNRINRQIDPNTNLSFIDTFNASPINTAEERVKVVDMTGTYAWETELGDFALRLDWSHTLEHTIKDSPGDQERDLRDDVFVAYDFRSRLTGSLSYRRGDFQATLTGIRNGSSPLWRPDGNDTSSQRLGPFITYNFTTQYNVSEDFQVGLRVTNLFNKFPPKDPTFLFYEYPWYNYFMYGGAGIGREAAIELEYSF